MKFLEILALDRIRPGLVRQIAFDCVTAQEQQILTTAGPQPTLIKIVVPRGQKGGAKTSHFEFSCWVHRYTFLLSTILAAFGALDFRPPDRQGGAFRSGGWLTTRALPPGTEVLRKRCARSVPSNFPHQCAVIDRGGGAATPHLGHRFYDGLEIAF